MWLKLSSQLHSVNAAFISLMTAIRRRSCSFMLVEGDKVQKCFRRFLAMNRGRFKPAIFHSED